MKFVALSCLTKASSVTNPSSDGSPVPNWPALHPSVTSTSDVPDKDLITSLSRSYYKSKNDSPLK